MTYKFRIMKYYDRFRAEVYNEKKDEYYEIGSPTGYPTPEAAKLACKNYKRDQEDKIVEEFEL